MRTVLTQSLLITCLFAGFTTWVQAAQDYAIQLNRSIKVGYKYALEATGLDEQMMSMSVNGQAMPARNIAYTLSVKAKAEVLATTPKGREQKTRFIITKATRTSAGQESDLLAAGTELVAERVGLKTTYVAAGMPVSPEVAKALEVIISMESDETANDDAVFGTKDRKKIGDSWPIDGVAGAADMNKRGGMKIDPANIMGKSTLVELSKVPQGEVLRIEAEMAMKDVSIPLPPGVAVTKSSFHATFAGLFPVDANQRALKKLMSMDGALECAGKTGDKEMAMSMTMKRSTEIIFTPQ